MIATNSVAARAHRPIHAADTDADHEEVQGDQNMEDLPPAMADHSEVDELVDHEVVQLEDEVVTRTGAAAGAVRDQVVVMVGIKRERRCREMLTWTLARFCNEGNRVIALHHHQNRHHRHQHGRMISCHDDQQHRNHIVGIDGAAAAAATAGQGGGGGRAAARFFDSITGVFDAFCNVKNVTISLPSLLACMSIYIYI
jgi:hypothetical protein